MSTLTMVNMAAEDFHVYICKSSVKREIDRNISSRKICAYWPDFVRKLKRSFRNDSILSRTKKCNVTDVEKVQLKIPLFEIEFISNQLQVKFNTLHIRWAPYCLLFGPNRTQSHSSFSQAFLHVSTAYSHCIRKDIGEEFYKCAITPDSLIDLVDAVDEERLKSITPGWAVLLFTFTALFAFIACSCTFYSKSP